MELSEQLTTLVDELIEAHDDTARLAADLVLDWRWQAHLCYLRELRRLGREALASASDCGLGGRPSRAARHRQFRSTAPRRGPRRCARHGHGESPA
jgi:hypothetical protein